MSAPTCVVFDVETIPDKRMTLDPEVCEFQLQDVKVGNRGEEKAEALRNEKLDQWRNGRAALEAWSAQIVSIGWSLIDERKVHVHDGESEKRVLSNFAAAMHELGGRVVLAGFNIARYDVPLVTMRCGIRGVDLPGWWPRVGDWRGSRADLYELFDAQKLAELAMAHRLPAKLGRGDQVKDMTQHERRRYVRRDVHIERALVRIYRNRFRALLAHEETTA